MQTCQNDLGLNLCIIPLTSYMVTISENSLVRSCKERGKACYIDTRDLVSTLVFQNKLLQCKLSDYILSMLSRVVI